ncbi:MAG: PilZ domain-containing protein [Candidatus Omnitrophica bacterium]|nr:PilZ domain-containing protein [Candidatus Omnitrophota bacterium]
MRNILVFTVALLMLSTISILLWRKRTSNVSEIPAYLDSYWDKLKEKRKVIRFKKRLPVTCSVPEKKGNAYHIFSNDISGEGVCLLAPEMLPEGSVLDLEIDISSGNPVAVKGEVVWVDKGKESSSNGERVFTAGIKFTRVDAKDKQRLNTFLEGGEEA